MKDNMEQKPTIDKYIMGIDPISGEGSKVAVYKIIKNNGEIVVDCTEVKTEDYWKSINCMLGLDREHLPLTSPEE